MSNRTTNDDISGARVSYAKGNKIEITLLGYRNAINIGKDVIRHLGSPSFICLKINEESDKLIITPCAEKEVLSFKVPDKLFVNRSCALRVYSKQFVHTIMECNGMEHDLTYIVSGYYSEKQNVVCFDLREKRLFETRKQQVSQ